MLGQLDELDREQATWNEDRIILEREKKEARARAAEIVAVKINNDELREKISVLEQELQMKVGELNLCHEGNAKLERELETKNDHLAELRKELDECNDMRATMRNRTRACSKTSKHAKSMVPS